MAPFSDLNTTWFALIGLLWTGYFFLEGFDFGVAVVTPFIIKDETDRRLCLNAVGPVWDGNEVWLLVAGGAMFAAFPLWYARLFSGFYLALFLVLVALIFRGVSFEFRGHDDRASWRRTWDVANFVGSLIPAVVWGVAFTDLVHGVPLSPGGHYYGGLPGLLHPIALVGGLASLAVFVFHGSLFLSLKTSGDVARVRAGAAATSVSPPSPCWGRRRLGRGRGPAGGGRIGDRRAAAHPRRRCRRRGRRRNGPRGCPARLGGPSPPRASPSSWRWGPSSAGCSRSSCRRATGPPTPSPSWQAPRSTTRSR